MRIIFLLVVGLHFFIVFGNFAAFFIIPFLTPWYEAIPLESIIVFLTFNRSPCPLTLLENWCRGKLGMAEIRGFIGHYLLRKGRKV